MKTKLTKAQRRIAVVEDAIAQLKMGTYVTGQFGYVALPNVIKEKKDDKSLTQAQQYLNSDLSKENFCGVCAKGSLFLSIVRKENELLLCDLADNHRTLMKRLTSDKLFDEHNLNLIEAYYEGWNLRKYKPIGSDSSGWVVISYDFVSVCAALGSGFSEKKADEFIELHSKKIAELKDLYPADANSNRTPRLIVILENMVQNKGVFKP